jgi:uncharacterized protein (TIGR03083 family)
MNPHIESPGPILTAHLLPKIEAKLLELLRSLKAPEWEVQTISPQWRVKDVAAHLLDTQLRKLSVVRDGFVAKTADGHSSADLVKFVDRLNEEGVRLYRRLSPPVLISLMEVASRQSAEFHQSLDPFDRAVFAVSWAGEETSLNWFDTAREYTERWHHQQQIRLAVDRPGIMTRELYHPVLECFMRGLPYAYRSVAAEPGALLQIDIVGDCGGTWRLYRQAGGWLLTRQGTGQPSAHVEIPQEIAWRIFTKGIDRTTAGARTRVEGNRDLGLHILQMLTIVG